MHSLFYGLTIAGVATVLAFLHFNDLRVQATPNSREKYVATSLAYLLQWPALALAPMLSGFHVVNGQYYFLIFDCVLAFVVFANVMPLWEDDDDNCWKNFKKKIKQFTASLSNPQLSPAGAS